MYRVTVLSSWRTVGDENHMAVAEDYPTPRGWGDVTGQDDASVPPDPNLFVAEGVITEAQLDALELDTNYVVLSAEVTNGEEV